jgi:hypothetical protein
MFLRMPLQFAEEDLTSITVWFTVAEMICGSDLEARSGKDESVETHSSGYSVPWHVEWATWMCLWRCRCEIFVVILGLFFKGVIEESRRTKAMAEMGKRVSKSLVLFLRLYMADVLSERDLRERSEYRFVDLTRTT